MRLLVRPESDSYSLTFAQEAIRTELDGGVGRYRLDKLNGAKMIDVVWKCDPDQYTYLMAFYRQQMRYGSEPFEMSLVVEEASTEVECTCHLIPGTLKLSSQSGLAYTVSASLEVETPFNEDQGDDDDDIIEAFNTSQGYTPP